MNRSLSNHRAFTLIEMIVAMTAAAILMLVVGSLLLGSHNAYRQVYGAIHKSIQQDCRVITVAFGSTARRSNRNDYTIYKVNDRTFTEAVPPRGKTLAAGQAVEFHYWDQSFEELFVNTDQMDTSDTGSHYTLFYLDHDKLYADYGHIINGAGGIVNNRRNEAGLIRRVLLSEYVDLSETPEIFSHEVAGGAGSGCVNLHITLTDDGGDSVQIKTASVLRVTWPN